jgi:hypothetical protein
MCLLVTAAAMAWAKKGVPVTQCYQVADSLSNLRIWQVSEMDMVL